MHSTLVLFCAVRGRWIKRAWMPARSAPAGTEQIGSYSSFVGILMSTGLQVLTQAKCGTGAISNLTLTENFAAWPGWPHRRGADFCPTWQRYPDQTCAYETSEGTAGSNAPLPPRW